MSALEEVMKKCAKKEHKVLGGPPEWDSAKEDRFRIDHVTAMIDVLETSDFDMWIFLRTYNNLITKLKGKAFNIVSTWRDGVF